MNRLGFQYVEFWPFEEDTTFGELSLFLSFFSLLFDRLH